MNGMTTVVNACRNPVGQGLIVAYIVVETALVGYGILIDDLAQTTFVDFIAIDILALSAGGFTAYFFMTYGREKDNRWYSGLARKLGAASSAFLGFSVFAWHFIVEIKIVELSLLIACFTGLPALLMYMGSKTD